LSEYTVARARIKVILLAEVAGNSRAALEFVHVCMMVSPALMQKKVKDMPDCGH